MRLFHNIFNFVGAFELRAGCSIYFSLLIPVLLYQYGVGHALWYAQPQGMKISDNTCFLMHKLSLTHMHTLARTQAHTLAYTRANTNKRTNTHIHINTMIVTVYTCGANPCTTESTVVSTLLRGTKNNGHKHPVAI